jgi:cytochrome c551
MPKKSFAAKAAAFLAPVALAAVVAACGGTGGASGDRPARGGPDGPAETLELYRSNCIACHAPDLTGNMGPSTDISQVGARLDRDEIRRRIAEGGDIMPAFADRLDDAEIDALAGWLAEQR